MEFFGKRLNFKVTTENYNIPTTPKMYLSRMHLKPVKRAVQYMRRVIEKKAKFDIMDLNCLLVASKTFIPVLFGHGDDDQFIQSHHSDLISESYAGDKIIIKFEGDHNSSQPKFFYDSVSLFFYNILHPPRISRAGKLEKDCRLGDSKFGSAVDKSLIYEILSNLRSATIDTASSSYAPPSILTMTSLSEFLSEVAPVTAVTQDFCSYASSTSKSWGRCSSLGGSDAKSSADFRADAYLSQSMKEKSADPKEDEKSLKKKKKKSKTVAKKIMSDRFERLDSLSRGLRHCLLKGSIHKRNMSS